MQKKFVAFDVSHYQVLTIGGHTNDTIQILGMETEMKVCYLLLQNDTWYLYVTPSASVCRNRQVLEGVVQLQLGDWITLPFLELCIHQSYFEIYAHSQQVIIHLPSVRARPLLPPHYHRAPRICLKEPEFTQKFSWNKKAPQNPKMDVFRIFVGIFSSLLSALVFGLIFKRGILTIFSIFVSVFSSILALFHTISQKRAYQKAKVAYIQKFEHDILAFIKQVNQWREAWEQYNNYQYPEVNQLHALLLQNPQRLYERQQIHSDFLAVRLGQTPTCLLEAAQHGLTEVAAEFTEINLILSQTRAYFTKKVSTPFVLSLNNTAIGFVGTATLCTQVATSLLLQLATFHSYHDVKLLLFVTQSDVTTWNWLRFLPHLQISEIYRRALLFEVQQQKVYLDFLLAEVNKQRYAKHAAKQRAKKVNYVLLIFENREILSHPLFELLKHEEDFGISVLYFVNDFVTLPDVCRTIIRIDSQQQGTLMLENGQSSQQPIQLDNQNIHNKHTFDKDIFVRFLAYFQHIADETDVIPEQVRLFELFQVKQAQELPILEAWYQNKPYEQLAAPIGVQHDGKPVILDIHESQHGPHGLLAGMTGAGKSEFLQSYVLALACRFHPHDLGFLFIDFKGGGMAQTFAFLPHHRGTITNLSGNALQRALFLLEAEIKKRQQLLRLHKLKHIDQYQQRFHQQQQRSMDRLQQTDTPKMPYLILIVDEFAELKQQYPQLLQAFISIARIGRSLGIHLLLATQKPAGVVDEQIWSNSRFRLCLRVQNTHESQDILKTNDAAYLTTRGRTFLQVGNNEIYQEFQTAWSSAPLNDATTNNPTSQNMDTIEHICEDGTFKILSRVKTRNDHSKENNEFKPSDEQNDATLVTVSENLKNSLLNSECSEIVAEIRKLVNQEQMVLLDLIFSESLPSRLFLEAQHFQTAWQKNQTEISVVIGKIDNPYKQQITDLTLNLTKNGHVLLLGNAGFGKTTTIRTLLWQLGNKYPPNRLVFYIFDLGKAEFSDFQNLPHLADTLTSDDVLEKYQRFCQHIEHEIHIRKQSNVSDVSDNHKTPPNIIICLDNYENLREMPGFDLLEQLFLRIVREGKQLGIYLICSALRVQNLRLQFYTYFEQQLQFYTHDVAEVLVNIGKNDFLIEKRAGHGLYKVEKPLLFQIGMLENVQNLSENPRLGQEYMQQVIMEMRAEYKGDLPRKIPLLANLLDYQTLTTTIQTNKQQKNLILGIDVRSLAFVYRQEEQQRTLVLYKQEKKKTQYLEWLQYQIEHIHHQKMQYIKTPAEIVMYNNTNKTNHESAFRNNIIEVNTQFVNSDSQIQQQIIDCLVQHLDSYLFIPWKQLQQMSLLQNFVETHIHNVVCLQPLSEQSFISAHTFYHEQHIGSNEAYVSLDDVITKIRYPLK